MIENRKARRARRASKAPSNSVPAQVELKVGANHKSGMVMLGLGSSDRVITLHPGQAGQLGLALIQCAQSLMRPPEPAADEPTPRLAVASEPVALEQPGPEAFDHSMSVNKDRS
jgi:hypothetical protein